MKKSLVAFAAGLLFAVGLALGGMTRPDKVIAFLDVFGDWDPSLAFVMLGAIGVYSPLFHLVMRRRKAPVLARRFEVPTRRDLTPSLVVGAVLFGAGWGLGGFCPGPAIASAATLHPTVWMFLGGMLGGMALYRGYEAMMASMAARKETAS